LHKQKIRVSVIAISISFLLLPILYPIDLPFGLTLLEVIMSGVENYLRGFFLYLSVGIVFIGVIGIPVNLLAGILVQKSKRFKHLVNFVIHLLPAFMVSVFFNFWEVPFIEIPVIVASIFFVVDEVIYLKINLKRKGYALILLVPILMYFIFNGPGILQNLEGKQTADNINKKGPPTITLEVQGKKIPWKEQVGYCWSSHDGCVEDTEPFLLPIDPIGITELTISGPTEFKFIFGNSVGDPEIILYYMEDEFETIKAIRVVNSQVEIPATIPEQAVKVVAKWDNNEMVNFLIALRTGER
jgi:hypothetical protein